MGLASQYHVCFGTIFKQKDYTKTYGPVLFEPVLVLINDKNWISDGYYKSGTSAANTQFNIYKWNH